MSKSDGLLNEQERDFLLKLARITIATTAKGETPNNQEYFQGALKPLFFML